MSFSLIGPFSFGAKVSSAQFNQLDTDHSLALDKSVAGDTLSGVITFASTATLLCGFANNIEATATGAIESGAAAGIASTVTGGISASGGSGDYFALSPSRTRVVRFVCKPIGTIAASWTMSTGGAGEDAQLQGLAAATYINLDMPTHHGATLTSFKVFLEVGNTHSAIPTNFPTLDIMQYAIGSASIASMFSGGPVAATAATGAAWFNGGVIQFWGGTTNQNNVIDTSANAYVLRLTDENGTGAHPANAYFGIELTYTNITTLVFP